MRTTLILSVLLCVACSALATPATAPAGPPAVSTSARVAPGSTILNVRDESPSPFSRPIVRFVVIPPGSDRTRVRLASAADAPATPVEVVAGAPMIVRGLSLVPVTISPRLEAGKNAAAATHEIDVDVRYDGNAAEGAPSAALLHGRGFFAPFAGLLAPEQIESLPATTEGSYLIVTDPTFLPAVQSLAAWKRAKGLDVVVVTTDDTGTQNTQIQQYISNLYHSSPNPPEYVLLVGDVPDGTFSGGIPTFDSHGAAGDLPYSLMDGTDFLPDLYLGRLPARSLDQAQTMVAKIIGYEQLAHPEVGTDWITRGLAVAADYGNTTAVSTTRWCRNQMLDAGYARVDTVYYPPFWSGAVPIAHAVNQGVSIVTYRGWAYGIYGWEPPHFTSTEVAGLTNGWMLPVVFSFVCETNDFANPDAPCMGESWMTLGTPTQPNGAVAFIGNSEHWSHTRFNDAAAIGAFAAIHGGTHRLGEILNTFKLQWFDEFPSEILDAEAGQESVQFYYHIYNLQGDPEMEIWTAPPKPITVTHMAPIPQWSNYLDVTVAAQGTGTPVAGARVGVSQGGNPIGCAWTDASGLAHVVAAFASATDSVTVTVSGSGVAPHQDKTVVSAGGAFLSLESASIDDDNAGQSHGNGNGIPNPGETIEIVPTLRNRGAVAATVVHADLSAVPGVTVLSGTASFPDVAPGATAAAQQPFVVQINATAEDGRIARLPMDVTADMGGATHSLSDVTLSVQAAGLLYESAAVEGDGILSPGETAGLTITLRNRGSIPSTTVSAVLHSRSTDLVTIADSVQSYPAADVGATAQNAVPFLVRANAAAGIGRVAALTMELTGADGQVSETSFSLTIGNPDHSAPLGPDAYGYYAYDNTDTDYPDTAPLFDYVNCSPSYGGSGTRLTLGDHSLVTVAVPFAHGFTFYGSNYTQMVVSDNGWLAFDTSTTYDFYNWHLPSPYGNGAKVAPFWDNLDPGKKRHGAPMADGIYSYYDAAHHRFIVEWSRIPNYNPAYDDLQTFEAILYDPDYYTTHTGDGIIVFQYKAIVNNDPDRMYSTVGIENASKDVGLEYTYSNLYPTAASPLAAGLAIRLTTDPPRYDPFHFSSFSASRMAAGVLMQWEPADARPHGGFRIYRSAAAGVYHPVTGRPVDAGERSFFDATADPDSVYSYKVGALDPFGRETVLGPFGYAGKDAPALSVMLSTRTPNPFRGSVDLSYSVPGRVTASLRIHDLAGRLVRTLVAGAVEAGSRTVTWDGRDEQGRDAPSGVYLCELRAGREQRSLKLTLLR